MGSAETTLLFKGVPLLHDNAPVHTAGVSSMRVHAVGPPTL